jgi:protein MpaA
MQWDKALASAPRWITIGHSVRGRRLRAHNIGGRSRRTSVAVVGCIHGNECAGRSILRQLRRHHSPASFELWLLRDLNPDASLANTRQNARGVDLNRNFPVGWRRSGGPWDTYYSGPRPWSEPETRAAGRFLRWQRPDITIWYHQHMQLVTKMKRHVRIQRRYARRVGLALTDLDSLPGTATRWQNRRWPRHTAFVVELSAGPLNPWAARRHARAVLEVARMWRRSEARRAAPSSDMLSAGIRNSLARRRPPGSSA